MGALKISRNQELKNLFLYKKVYIIFLFIFLIYFLYLLINITQYQGNIYDYIFQLTELHPIHYVITPIYLVLLILVLSLDNIKSSLIIKFKNKLEYYNTQIIIIAYFTFLFVIIATFMMLLLACFSLSFQNEWSEFAKNNYINSKGIVKSSPLIGTIISIILLYFDLFFKALICFSVYILTKNRFTSFMIVFAVNGLNLLTLLNYWDSLNKILPFNYLRIFISNRDLIASSLLLRGFVYYGVLVAFFYMLGWIFLKKTDIEKSKEM